MSLGPSGSSSSQDLDEVARRRAPVWLPTPDMLLTGLGYLALATVQVCIAVMSWTGLVGFAEHSLHLGRLSFMVPISLDGAGMAAAFLAMRSAIRGDSSSAPRALVVTFTAASAGFNWHHALLAYHDTAPAVFFAGMSVGVLLVFDLVLRQMRRHALRDIGAVERPLPRFRLARWVRFPRETASAWSLAVRYGITSPQQALARVWQIQEVRQVTAAQWEGLNFDEIDLSVMKKREAITLALSVTCGNVPAAIDLLLTRGIKVDKSQAYTVKRELAASTGATPACDSDTDTDDSVVRTAVAAA